MGDKGILSLIDGCSSLQNIGEDLCFEMIKSFKALLFSRRSWGSHNCLYLSHANVLRVNFPKSLRIPAVNHGILSDL